MKKTLAILLCLATVLFVWSAGAEEFQYSLLQVLSRQLNANSGYRGTLSAELAGDAPAFIDQTMWAALKRALPGLTLQGTYIESQAIATRGDTQLKLTLGNAAGTLSTLLLSGRDDLYVLSGDLLGTETVALPKDAGALYELLLGAAQGQWPPLTRALFALLTADDAYKARLDACLAPYEAKLNVWLQSYTDIKLERDANGAMITRARIDIPARAVTLEAKQLLIDLYADDELLSLLREKLTPAEAAVYLEPGMQPLFLRALDSLTLSESVTLSRSFNAQGAMTEQTLYLPFDASMAAAGLTVSALNGAEQAQYAFTLAMHPDENALAGAEYRLTLAGGALPGEGAGDTAQSGYLYTGAFAYTAPLAKEAQFTVSEGAQAQQTPADAQRAPALEVSYSLFCDHGAESYDAAADRRSRAYEATLLLRPVGTSDFTAQSLSLKASLYAGSSSTTATHLDASLAWREVEGDSAITLNYVSRSTSAFAQTAADVQGAARPDLMTDAQRSAWKNGLAPLLRTRLNALLAQALGLTLPVVNEN